MTSFDMVFKDHYSKLFTLAFRMTGKREDAEDILQEAFLNAYKGYDHFREESSVYTWLYRIVIREAKRYKNKMNKLPVEQYANDNNLSIEEIYTYVNSYGDAEDEAMTEMAKETCLQLFMNCMPPSYRTVFTLRMILKMSVSETAEILEIKESTVKVYLHRGRQIIKSFMDGKCSLINPNNPCRCSAWVNYAKKTGKHEIVKDIQVKRNNEKALSEEFKLEVIELYKIVELYNTTIMPNAYEAFKEHIKKIVKERKSKLLDI